MFRFALALVALVLLSDAASACFRPFARARGVAVARERHVVRQRGPIMTRLATGPLFAPKAAPCGPTGCPSPMITAKK